MQPLCACGLSCKNFKEKNLPARNEMSSPMGGLYAVCEVPRFDCPSLEAELDVPCSQPVQDLRACCSREPPGYSHELPGPCCQVVPLSATILAAAVAQSVCRIDSFLRCLAFAKATSLRSLSDHGQCLIAPQYWASYLRPVGAVKGIPLFLA